MISLVKVVCIAAGKPKKSVRILNPLYFLSRQKFDLRKKSKMPIGLNIGGGRGGGGGGKIKEVSTFKFQNKDNTLH